MSESPWLIAALWIGLALLATLISIRTAISVALIELIVGAAAGNVIPWVGSLLGTPAKLEITPWINFLAGAGSDPSDVSGRGGDRPGRGAEALLVQREHRDGWLLCPLFRRPGVHALRQGVALAPGPDRRDRLVHHLGGRGLRGDDRDRIQPNRDGQDHPGRLFRQRPGNGTGPGALVRELQSLDGGLLRGTGNCPWFLPKFSPWFFAKVGNRVSEPESKFILLVLFALGGLGNIAASEAVLPAYLVGMVLAPYFLRERVLAQRLRVMAFTLLTPFYFLKAGSLVKASTVMAAFGLIAVLLGIKMLTKFLGIWPLTKGFHFGKREGMYTTLLMSTGLTFGSISALFGLTQRDHQSGPVHGAGHRCDRQRLGPDLDRSEVVPASPRPVRGDRQWSTRRSYTAWTGPRARSRR